MAVAYDAVSSSAGGTASVTTKAWTHTPVGTPTAVAVLAFSEVSTDPTITGDYGGTPLVSKGSVFASSGTGRCELFVLASPPSGAQTVTMLAATGHRWLCVAITVTGGGGIGTFASTSSFSGTTMTLTGVVANENALIVAGVIATAATLSTSTGTERSEQGFGNNPVNSETVTQPGEVDTSVDITILMSASTTVGIVAIPITAGTEFTSSVAGTLTTAGGLTKLTSKIVAGTLTTAGAIIKAIFKTSGFAGTLTTAGTLLKQAQKVLAGTLTSAGAMTFIRVYTVVIEGALTMAGTLSKDISKIVAGTLTTAGAVVKLTTKTFAGTLTMAGSLAKQFAKIVGGALTFSGSLVRLTTKFFSGTLTFEGELSRKIAQFLYAIIMFIRRPSNRITAKVDPSLVVQAVIAPEETVTFDGTPSSAVQADLEPTVDVEKR